MRKTSTRTDYFHLHALMYCIIKTFFNVENSRAQDFAEDEIKM